MMVEALTAREHKQAKMALQKEEMLRHQSLPPNDCDQYYKPPPAGSAHSSITKQAVKQVLFSQSVKKAPE